MEDVQEIFSNYKDNPYLHPDLVKELEGLIHQDVNFDRIFRQGEWGTLDNLIFTTWSSINPADYASAPGDTYYGLDFGYTNPSALVKVKIDSRVAYAEEMLYRTQLTNTDLITQLKDLIPEERRRRDIIWCDSAEPDRIMEISKAGFRAEPAFKDVSYGIDLVKSFKLHINNSSSELLKELKSYSWKKEKATGKLLDEPIAFNDHACSALRYCIASFAKEHAIGRPKIRTFTVRDEDTSADANF
jgi:phage terminase large subunit